MKRIFLLLLGLSLCACGRYGCGVPAEDEPLLDAALADCPRADSLRQLLRETPRDRRAGMAFLVAYMPQGDRDTMRLDLLRENVEYAYRARAEYPWTRALPDSVFLNDVLPYAVVDEVRDSWRPDFYARFARRAAGAADVRAAIDSINRHIAADVAVEYNTAREKTNQSPSESMRQHMASCTGLSVLLVDALRSAGIPARFGRDEEHFEHIAVDTCERGESPEHPVLVQALRSAGFSCLAGCPGLVPVLLSCGCSGFRRFAVRLPDDV